MTDPLSPKPEVLDFLATRRSRPAKTLGPEAPDSATLSRIMQLASRVPDHGKLVPWRFLVLGPATRERLSREAGAHMAARGVAGPDAEKAAQQFRQGGAILAVVASPVPADKVPDWEQALAAGCVCFGALNAALAMGWGANWLTGPLARDAAFLSAIGLSEREWVAGFIHIGRETVVPPDRERPEMERIVRWMD